MTPLTNVSLKKKKNVYDQNPANRPSLGQDAGWIVIAPYRLNRNIPDHIGWKQADHHNPGWSQGSCFHGDETLSNIQGQRDGGEADRRKG